MSDWADETASRVVGDVAGIAAALRTERELSRQIEADQRAELTRWQRIAADRLKTIKGIKNGRRAGKTAFGYPTTRKPQNAVSGQRRGKQTLSEDKC